MYDSYSTPASVGVPEVGSIDAPGVFDPAALYRVTIPVLLR